MNRSPIAHLVSGVLLAVGVSIAKGNFTLACACAAMTLYLCIVKEFAMLRRCALALMPIGTILFAVSYAARFFNSAQPQEPLTTLLRLAAMMLVFTYVTAFFMGDKSATRLIQLGLKGEWLIISLSATATLPLLQATAMQIVDARYAAGFARSRSFASRAAQLPFVLRPLLVQALRLAIARSDTWHERGLMDRLERNLAVIVPRRTFGITDSFAIILPLVWIVWLLASRHP